MFHSGHHNRHKPISLRPAEPGRKVCRKLQILFRSSCCRGFQHHMASRTLLCVKPQISCTSLPKADPLVLAMIAADLNQQSVLSEELQRLWLSLGWTTAAASTARGQQVLEFNSQFTQLSDAIVGIVPVSLHQVRQKVFAAVNQRQPLIVMIQSLFDRGNGTSQPSCTLIKLLGPFNTFSFRSGLTENGISLMLQIIGASSGVQSLDLLEALCLFFLSALFQKLLKFQALSEQLSLVEMIAVVQP